MVSEVENEEKYQSKSGKEMPSLSMGQKHGMDQGSRECADLEICIDSSLVVSFL